VNVHPALRYTTLRLALFSAVVLLLALFRVRGLLLLALAVLISGLASYSLLSRQRDAMSASFGSWAQRLNRRIDERARAEDDLYDDERRGTDPAPGQDVPGDEKSGS
jgi:hypothetical protein